MYNRKIIYLHKVYITMAGGVGEVYILPKSAAIPLLQRVWHATPAFVNLKGRVLELTYEDCLEFMELHAADPDWTLLKFKNLNLHVQMISRFPLRSQLRVTIQNKSIASLAPQELAEILHDLERTYTRS